MTTQSHKMVRVSGESKAGVHDAKYLRNLLWILQNLLLLALSVLTTNRTTAALLGNNTEGGAQAGKGLHPWCHAAPTGLA